MDVTAEADAQLNPGPYHDAGRVPILKVSSPRRRRKPLVALGSLMVVMSALVAAWLVASAGETYRVVVANGDLQPGRQIGEGDLMVVEIGGGIQPSSIPADDQAVILGLFPIGPIPAGTVLNKAMFIDRSAMIPEGRVVVGAVLQPGQLPVDIVEVGDQVELIDTGDVQEDEPAQTIGVGTVFAISNTDGGYWVAIDVAVDERLAVAGAAASGHLSLGMVG